ncbi:interleukin-15-like [Accipiter gentilis]|uniref:interleukin-15-like n=1 Tax=Astur gentilis TaxID=8957 RepID=UPI00211080B2|nr:interleukin-15-like [Accipiter gentilis]
MMCKVLIFSCISAVMLMTAAYGAPLSKDEEGHLLKALIEDLKLLEKSKDKIHFELYTPDEKHECNRTSLQCYLRELSTLENEIEDEDVDNLQNIIKNLQSLTAGNQVLIPQGNRCKICEANQKKNFTAFHHELNNLLKSMLK